MLRHRRRRRPRIEVELTTKEFDLLELLMRQPGVTIKRERIMSEVWDSNWWGSTRTLDTHTSTLRRKILDETDPPSKIVTVRGVGFRFEPVTRATDDAPPSGPVDGRRGDRGDPRAARAGAADRAQRRRVGAAVTTRPAARPRSPPRSPTTSWRDGSPDLGARRRTSSPRVTGSGSSAADGDVIAERNVDGIAVARVDASATGPRRHDDRAGHERRGTERTLPGSGRPPGDRRRRWRSSPRRLLATIQARQLATPLERLARSASRLGDGDFSVTGPPPSGIREIDDISRALRLSANRVERMLNSERGFTADATHQLRTGLTGIAMRLEVLERDDDPAVAAEADAALVADARSERRARRAAAGRPQGQHR